ncbi:MAG: SDR family NAD(P)-dependent oxidoreductase, partial [Deltaproteobacteria bacterium]|nr:SDR family NAD(P)-dependent oxidoreductase [Deltaproteobacteria bacterium]
MCIVTGAGTGIGRATAIAAAANGLTVVGVDINEEEGEKTREMAHKMGGRMVFARADLTRDREIEDCLMKHAAVAMVAVVGSPDPVRGEVVKAFIVPKVG